MPYIEANRDAVDIVLSDVDMPGALDGIALGELLRREHPDLALIRMTGYGERLEQAVQQQFEVLPKPCSFDVLARAVAKIIGQRAARDRRRDGRLTT